MNISVTYNISNIFYQIFSHTYQIFIRPSPTLGQVLCIPWSILMSELISTTLYWTPVKLEVGIISLLWDSFARKSYCNSIWKEVESELQRKLPYLYFDRFLVWKTCLLLNSTLPIMLYSKILYLRTALNCWHLSAMTSRTRFLNYCFKKTHFPAPKLLSVLFSSPPTCIYLCYSYS